MSVRDLYKVINVYDCLDNRLLFSLDYDDFSNFTSCENYFSNKIISILQDNHEVFIKFGYKNYL